MQSGKSHQTFWRKMKVRHSSKMMVDFYQTAWHYISENRTLYSLCCENLKFNNMVAREECYFANSNIKDILSVLSMCLCTPREVYSF